MSVQWLKFESAALKGNRLGDPHSRDLAVYVPEVKRDSYPVIYLLSAHGRTNHYYVGWNQYEETLPQRLDRLMAEGKMEPCLVVLPDAWTRFGGSQYLNSPIGNYETYVVDELVPFVEANFPVMVGREHRAVCGHSSGGYGALTLAMRRPEIFSAVGAKAPDAYWEFNAMPALARFASQVEKHGGIGGFIEAIPTIRPKRAAFWEGIHTAMYSMAYAPNPDAPLGFDEPFDAVTGAMLPAVWERWLQHDPTRMVEKPDYQAALRQLTLLFLEVGAYDDYQLQVGARLLHQKMTHYGISHQYQEFPDGHSDTSYRFDVSLPLLAQAIG